MVYIIPGQSSELYTVQILQPFLTFTHTVFLPLSREDLGEPLPQCTSPHSGSRNDVVGVISSIVQVENGNSRLSGRVQGLGANTASDNLGAIALDVQADALGIKLGTESLRDMGDMEGNDFVTEDVLASLETSGDNNVPGVVVVAELVSGLKDVSLNE